jgi:hypothetical protein
MKFFTDLKSKFKNCFLKPKKQFNKRIEMNCDECMFNNRSLYSFPCIQCNKKNSWFCKKIK